ncbi:MAG: glycosyltransferase [Oscillospiraceae bacterium]|nr:glycosyltransferase [Oscillospiraceae bacterium]
MDRTDGVTLIVPAETESPYLDDCLRSIAAQTGGVREVACVLGAACPAPAAELDGLRVIRASEGRFAAGVNRCLEEAGGGYCAFVHPDDYLKPGFAESGLSAAEEYGAELVLFESGERGRKTGTLRNRFISLRKELLPPEPCFAPRELAGNCFLLARTPSWLTLFRTDFLRENGLRWLSEGSNDYYMGRCALALARRACAVSEPMAWLHETKADFTAYAREMEALCAALWERGRWDELGAAFAHALLAAAVGALRGSGSERERLSVLQELNSKRFAAMDLLDRDARFYRFPSAQKNAACLRAALRRYERTKQTPQPANVETVFDRRENNFPLVTVVIPAYNTAAYVEQAVCSILNQTLREFELICVDDGSTDETPEILDRLARDDARVVFLRQENRGVSAARNAGLSLARGKWLYFFDSDDFLMPKGLEQLCQIAERDGLDLLAFNGENHYDRSLSEKRKKFRPGRFRFQDIEGVLSGPELFHRLYEAESYTPSVNMQFFRRSFLEREGLRFREGIVYEDEPFSYAANLKAKRAELTELNCYRRRLRENSIMTSDLRFENVRSCLIGFLDMVRILHDERTRMNDEQAASAERHLEAVLRVANRRYAQLAEEERAEVWGLGEEFSLFRCLVHDPVERKLKAEEIREKRAAEQKSAAEAEREAEDGERALQAAQSALEESRAELRACEESLARTRAAIRQTEEALKRLREETPGGETHE